MRAFALFALLTVSGHAFASETIIYTYDARGRLVRVDHTGTVNNGVVTTYELDKADNRTKKTTAAPPPGTVVFTIFDGTAVEGGSIEFTVTKSGAALASHSVNYATSNGTAVTPQDYTATSGTLTFAQNETSKTVTVQTNNNSLPESSEEFQVNLSSPTGNATINDGQGVGTIFDNDQGGTDCFTNQLGQIVCQ